MMRYCGPKGIPYETFLDWGQLSKDAALAWQADEDDHCGECGQRRSDWFGPDGKELRDPPTLPVDVKCPSCEALEMHREEEKRRPGMKVAFRPVRVWDDDRDEWVDGSSASDVDDDTDISVTP